MGGLFDCFSDMGTCLMGSCCYTCLAGQTHQRAGLGPCWQIPAYCFAGALVSIIGASGAGIPCLGIFAQLYPFILLCEGRKDIQRITGATQEDAFTRCLVTFCCTNCMVCQEVCQRARRLRVIALRSHAPRVCDPQPLRYSRPLPAECPDQGSECRYAWSGVFWRRNSLLDVL